ncbi:MAG: phenylacetate--CoA ligase family protein [Candidatus Zixiibacteriota bacterium]|nr:MAG: phenylacetate--CoA ligase family protein [candidate division Zixibacteria bacterium]
MRSPYQRFVERVLYPLDVMRRGSRELRILTRLEETERFGSEKLHDLRLGALLQLLDHATRYVPFYQKRFAESGFNINTVKDFDDLKRLPILTKRDIQDHREELISTFYDRGELVENRTGGSTGSPLVFYHHKERLDSRQAATLRHNRWAGYPVGCKAAILWGHQHDISLYRSFKARLRNLLIDRQLICDSGSFSEETLSQFTRDFRRFRPEIIVAYANSLGVVVDYCIAKKIALPRPRGIITSAEVLTYENRAKIESYFGVRIFDRYGSRETSVIASECEAHAGLHINAENLYLEFVEHGKDVEPGAVGEIIVTDLGNWAFPFIRYQIGDMGSPAKGLCRCGRTLPRMQMIAGRTTDFLYAPDGRRVSGAALTIYLAAKVPGVRQAQIIQREKTTLIFNLVVDSNFDQSSLGLIREKVTNFFGESMQIVPNYVESIPKEPSGKYRFSICELPITEMTQ